MEPLARQNKFAQMEPVSTVALTELGSVQQQAFHKCALMEYGYRELPAREDKLATPKRELALVQ
ncbi:MAG: hypothetical protein V1833_04060 [Elusimicrobiota bacterium]